MNCVLHLKYELGNSAYLVQPSLCFGVDFFYKMFKESHSHHQGECPENY